MHNLTVTIAARLYHSSLDHHHGKPIRTFRPRAAHSFLAQFIEFLKVQMSQVTTSITKTAGTELTPAPAAYNLRVNASGGIRIGSGTDAVDIDDYKIQTEITTDITASAHAFALSYPTATSRRLSISRTFTNGSAAPIPIEEVALYCTDGQNQIYALDRTLYSVSIPAASDLELTYRIDVSV